MLNNLIQLIKNKRSLLKKEKALGDELSEFSFLINYNKNIVNPILAKPFKTIVFIIPTIQKFSGGITSILKLGTAIQKLGYEVFFYSIHELPIAELRENARINYQDLLGTILTKPEFELKSFDVGVATFWPTAYQLSSMANISYKAYFIQDFEPYFYSMSDLYLLSKSTYSIGLKMITLGTWNKERIETFVDYKGKISAIEFPLDTHSYPIIDKPIDYTQNIKIAVYIREDGKRCPLLLGQCLTELKRQAKIKNKSLEVNLFGLNDKFKIPYGNNLGKLSLNEMKTLYDNSNIGIATSLTNVSLVPFEMMSRGLPVVDFIGSSANHFFKSGIHYAESTPSSFCQKIWEIVSNSQHTYFAVKEEQARMSLLSWDRSAVQFIEALLNEEQ